MDIGSVLSQKKYQIYGLFKNPDANDRTREGEFGNIQQHLRCIYPSTEQLHVRVSVPETHWQKHE